MGARGVARWMLWDRLVHRRPRRDAEALPRRAIPSHPARVSAPKVVVTWVGHSSFLIQLDGVNLLTDPMWSDRASPLSFLGPKRLVPPGIPFDALPPIDAVLLSHNHYDHLDAPTVRHLARRYPDTAWFTPLGIAPFVRARGASSVAELDWWEEASLGGVRVACTPAQHFSARGLRDRGRTLWCGWSIMGPTRRVFFAGDSAYHPEFVRIGERHGPFDITMLPVGAYEPRWFMQPVHMTPEEGVRAHLDVCAPHESRGSTVMVPMHWGTFRLTDEPMDEPPARARAAWDAEGLPERALWLLSHGETRRL
ncbi:MAG: MBL fold metallo-hydrolase [Gemmatimonadaceae bacterium]